MTTAEQRKKVIYDVLTGEGVKLKDIWEEPFTNKEPWGIVYFRYKKAVYMVHIMDEEPFHFDIDCFFNLDVPEKILRDVGDSLVYEEDDEESMHQFFTDIREGKFEYIRKIVTVLDKLTEEFEFSDVENICTSYFGL